MHTTLPPEQVFPARKTDPTFLRADAFGTTIDLARWTPKAPAPLPFLVGANSTPLAMLMTPMLPLYPRYWQDALLTEQAERGYDDVVISHEPWNEQENGRTFTTAEMIDWCKYVKSCGFRTVIWRGDRPPERPDDRTKALLDAGVVNFLIWGKEVDAKMTSEEYDVSLGNIDAYVGGRIPIGAHFTADDGRQMGYPIGFPRDTFLGDWSPYDGRVHLMQQLDVDAPAGKQGASMWYARQHVNCGIGDAVPDHAKGKGAPNSRVILFEISATAQLYGRMTEEDGCRRTWELLCGTRTNEKARPASGFANGCRYPDGRPI